MVIVVKKLSLLEPPWTRRPFVLVLMTVLFQQIDLPELRKLSSLGER